MPPKKSDLNNKRSREAQRKRVERAHQSAEQITARNTAQRIRTAQRRAQEYAYKRTMPPKKSDLNNRSTRVARRSAMRRKLCKLAQELKEETALRYKATGIGKVDSCAQESYYQCEDSADPFLRIVSSSLTPSFFTPSSVTSANETLLLPTISSVQTIQNDLSSEELIKTEKTELFECSDKQIEVENALNWKIKKEIISDNEDFEEERTLGVEERERCFDNEKVFGIKREKDGELCDESETIVGIKLKDNEHIF